MDEKCKTLTNKLTVSNIFDIEEIIYTMIYIFNYNKKIS